MYTFLKGHPYPSQAAAVIRVKGSDYEMGRSHAEQTQPFLANGMAKFYYDFWRRMLNQSPQGWIESVAYRAVTRLIDPVLVNKLKSKVPVNVHERLRGVADASGQKFEDLMLSLVLPDLLPLLEIYASRFRLSAIIDVIEPPRFGCTSFVQAGENFFYGRNLDFPGVGYWDRYPVIQVTEPTKGLRYIGFTTAGVPIGGITGINEAQISVALHQHYCSASNLNGMLPFLIAENVLENARTLDSAIEMVRSAQVTSSWAFVMTDGKSRQAVIVEKTPRNTGVRRLTAEDPVLAHSNFYQTSECKLGEFATTMRMNWDNYFRKERLESLVRNCKGKMTAAMGVKCLSDHFDPYWGEEKIINRTVSQVYNIQSVLIDPVAMKAYLAEGDAPIHVHDYFEYDLGALFAGSTSRTGGSLPAYRFQNEARLHAKEAYILSFVAAFDGNLEKAVTYLDEVLKDEMVPEAASVSAVIRLKQGDYETGKRILAEAMSFIEKKANEKGLSALPPEYFEIGIFLARAHDLLGERRQALAIYRSLESREDLEDANIRKLVRKAGPYKAKQLARILMPYSSYIPFD